MYIYFIIYTNINFFFKKNNITTVPATCFYPYKWKRYGPVIQLGEGRMF